MLHKACMPVYKLSRKLLRTDGKSKVLQEVLADLKIVLQCRHHGRSRDKRN